MLRARLPLHGESIRAKASPVSGKQTGNTAGSDETACAMAQLPATIRDFAKAAACEGGWQLRIDRHGKPLGQGLRVLCRDPPP